MPANLPAVVVPSLSPRIGFMLAGVLLLAVFALSLPDDFLWQRVIEDAGHGPVFAALAVVLLWLSPPAPGESMRGLGQYLRVFGLAFGLGVVTELLQWFLPHRNVSARDVLHDSAGAALGLAVFWLVERRLARKAGVADGGDHRAVAVAVALCGFVLLAWEPLQCARAYADRARAWPTLLPLGEMADAAFSKVNLARRSYAPLPARYARPGDGPSLRLQFAAGTRPGLQLFEPSPDWSGKDAIVIDVTNPSSRPLHLVLRIFDRTHDWTHGDRFNQPIVIPAASRMQVRIALEAVAASPRKRRMDLTAVADVMLFARRPLDAGEFYLTRVALE